MRKRLLNAILWLCAREYLRLHNLEGMKGDRLVTVDIYRTPFVCFYYHVIRTPDA